MRGISGSKAKGPIPDGFSDKRLLVRPFEDSLPLPMNLAFGTWLLALGFWHLAIFEEISRTNNWNQSIANSLFQCRASSPTGFVDL